MRLAGTEPRNQQRHSFKQRWSASGGRGWSAAGRWAGSAAGALLGVLALASLALLGASAAQTTPGALCGPVAARLAALPAPADPPVPPLTDFYLTPYPSPVLPSAVPLST